MPIDAGIYANLLRGPKSVEEYDNEANAARTNALQLQQQGLQVNALAQQQKDDQALRNYLSGNVKLDTPEGQAGLYRVAPKAAGGILKSQAEIAQANAAAKKDAEQGGKAAQEKVGEAMKNSRYNLEGVTTPEQYIAWHEQNHKDPVLGPYLASRGVTADQARARISEMLQKPGGFEQLVNESKLGAEKAYDHAMKQQEFGLKQNQFGETVRHNKSAEGIQIRGQNMNDSRARDFNAVQVEANNIKRSEKQDVANMTKNSQVASFDTMLGTLDRLTKHPGLSRSVGMVGAFPTMPGSESANFQAELDTFQSQAFIPMVAQLKGMGALSDAEGKKLTAAVGALNPKMGEQAFRDSVARITADMEAARARVSGQPRAPKPAMSPQDQQAAEWANANPNDPRAAKIKQRLGL